MRSRVRACNHSEEIVTGERLQSIADLTVLSREVRHFHRHVERHAREMVIVDDFRTLDEGTIDRLSRTRTLFVYTHELRAFIDHVWPRLGGRGYVVMTHNSDFAADESYLPWLDATGDKLGRWFAQNATIAHPKVVPVPVGIANSMWPHGDLRVLCRAIARYCNAPKKELAFVQFDPRTHPHRQAIWDTLRASFPGMASRPPAPRRYGTYLRRLARCKFCVCPRGNGIDTHRVWECLYLGVVPIVERSTHSEHWARRGLSLLLVDDWSEVTPERLQAEASVFAPADRTPAYAPLRLSHYAELVGEHARHVSPAATRQSNGRGSDEEPLAAARLPRGRAKC